MNISERGAYDFLRKLGYVDENIFYYSHTSPDFKAYKTIKGHIRWSGWEVKTLPIHYTENQLESMSYNTNIIVMDGTKVIGIEKFYKHLIKNYLKNNSHLGETKIELNGAKINGFFHPIFFDTWSDSSDDWSYAGIFKTMGLLPLEFFGTCLPSRFFERDRNSNININLLKNIKNNISNYFNGMNEREAYYKKLKSEVWWV